MLPPVPTPPTQEPNGGCDPPTSKMLALSQWQNQHSISSYSSMIYFFSIHPFGTYAKNTHAERLKRRAARHYAKSNYYVTIRSPRCCGTLHNRTRAARQILRQFIFPDARLRRRMLTIMYDVVGPLRQAIFGCKERVPCRTQASWFAGPNRRAARSISRYLRFSVVDTFSYSCALVSVSP